MRGQIAEVRLGRTRPTKLPYWEASEALTYNVAMKANHIIGAVVAMVLSGYASFTFLRGSLTGAPPMYSHGWFRRGLHFVAGIIFAFLAIFAALKLAGKW